MKNQPKNQSPNPQQKIISFSESAYSIAAAAFVAFIVMAVLQAAALVWIALELSVESFGFTAWDVKIPGLLQIGAEGVYLPGTFGEWTAEVLPGGVFAGLRTLGIIVILHYAKAIFKILYKSGSPFTAEIAALIKKIAIALIFLGAFTGLVGFVAAGVVWFFYLVFEYGSVLQEESDATL